MKTQGDQLDLNFEVDVVEGGTSRRAMFSELLGDLNLVSIYMKNNTPSCDAQNKSLHRGLDALAGQGVRVFAVSPDGPKSHANYAGKHGLQQVLVSDKAHRFAQAADALVEKNMYGKTYTGPARAAFLLDGEGVVLAVIEKVDPKAHGEQVEAALNEVRA